MIVHIKTDKAYNRDNIFRRLRIKEGTPAWIHAERNFAHLVEVAFANMEMTTCYIVRDCDLDIGREMPPGCEKLIIAFASSSRRIMSVILRLMDEGKFMDSYVLNDLVNEILFHAAEQMNLEIERRMRAEGLSLTSQISPGEQGVEMRYQEVLMSALKAEGEVPATLTESYMIDPEKSLLYAYGAGRGFAGTPVEHDCENCSLETCFYRES